MKRFITAFFAAILCIGMAWADNPLAIAFRTNIYNEYGAANSFHFVIGTTETTYIDVDCGFGPVEYEIQPAEWNDSTNSVVGTPISCQVNSGGMVRIYCDPALIDFFDCEGCYIRHLDLGDCTNLEILDVSHNELEGLDLTKYTNLQALYLADNPMSKSPLVIGRNKPNLTILDMMQIDNLAADFDIDTYSNLVSFDAYHTLGLKKITPAGCPKLRRLSLDCCAVSKLDITNNPALEILNISDTRITEIDLSKNTRLTQLYASHTSGVLNTTYKLSDLNVSQNTSLWILNASNNNLKSIDLTRNIRLMDINLSRNYLTSIDVSQNSYLNNVNLDKNYIYFSALPAPQNSWNEYYYEQKPIPLKKSYEVGSVIDLSDKVLRAGSETTCQMFVYSTTTDSAVVLDPSKYSYADGKLTLSQVIPDSIYAVFYNSVLYDYNVKTSLFKVKSAQDFGKASKIVSFTSSVAVGGDIKFGVGLDCASEASPKTVYIDLGDGNLTPFAVTSSMIPAENNIVATRKGSGAIAIYVAEDDVLTALSCDGLSMNSINLKEATELRYLSLTNCKLFNIDLGYSRCLMSLDLSGNLFTSLTLKGVNYGFEKNVLSSINLSNNRLSSLDLNEAACWRYLNLSHNRLTEFLNNQMDSIKVFDISYNNLEDINLEYCVAAKTVNLSNNNLKTIKLPYTNEFETFDLSNNAFTFATLPAISGLSYPNYICAPQKEIALPTRGPGANLSAQVKNIGSYSTNFIWYKADGTTLEEGVDYTNTNGVFHFINTNVGAVYCAMTNGAYPDFVGEKALKTSKIVPAPMPTNCLAVFDTPVGGEAVNLSLAANKAGVALYIDWTGTGTLEQYLLKDTYTEFSATTTKDAKVKVYTYDPEEKITVFSIRGCTMGELDASKLVDVITFNVNGAGLSDMKFPNSPNLYELMLANNAFTTFDVSKFPNLGVLALSGNKLTTLDLSVNKNLGLVSAGHNQLTSVTLDNPNLWYLDLGVNQLESIDLSKVPVMQQLSLSNNLLSSIDITPMTQLLALLLDRNNLSFATLPEPQAKFVLYTYAPQPDLKIEAEINKVDLSAQASVGSTPSTFDWFIGRPDVDDNGNLVGEQLVIDAEYTLVDGTTTFLSDFTDLVCVVRNEALPSLKLFTNSVAVTSAGVDTPEEVSMSVTVDGRNINIATTMPNGTVIAYYTIDGQCVARTTVVDGHATLTNLPAGVAILTAANMATKIRLQ